MDAERTDIITDFEEKEKEILEFEAKFIKNEQLLKELTEKCQVLEQKLKMLEEKSSQDEVIAAQMNELRSQIAEYEQKAKEAEDMSERLRNALGNIQEENIKLEDELNSIKSDTGDIKELRSKLQVLEETVIAQQKELVEKDKILKGEFVTEEGSASVSALQRFIVGKVETINEFKRLIESTEIRLFIVVPTIEDLEQLDLHLDPKIGIRIATSLDPSNTAHKKIIETLPNAMFRNYSGKDRWGIERDAEEVCLIAESENKDYIGISSSDSKICELFSKLLTEAWLKGERVNL